MATYRIMLKGNDIKAINTGFNWWACIFSGFWALFNGMIGTFFLTIVVNLCIRGLGAVNGLLGFIAALGVCIYFGVNGNTWKVNQLQKRGYKEMSDIDARNVDEATRYYSSIHQADSMENEASNHPREIIPNEKEESVVENVTEVEESEENNTK
jgi:hypothetical protein